jgi:hypothetical protein
MPNIWEHPDTIAQEALGHLENALVIAPMCARDLTSEFSNKSNGWKVGDVVSFRTNGEYVTKEFTGTIEPQQISGSTRPLTIEKFFDTSVEITARELAMDLDSLSDQVLRPAMYKFAETIDFYLGTKLMQAQGLYASDGLFASAADISQARKAAVLQQLAVDRFCLVDLDVEATLLGQTWINQSMTRGADGENALRNAEMGRLMKMDFASSLSFPTNSSAHTCGTGTALTNNGTAVNGIFPNNAIGVSTLTIDGGSANTFIAGDRLKIAGVRRPVIVKTTTAALTGVTSVALEHPITEVIPDNAAVTVIGSGQSLTYHGAIMDGATIGAAFPMLDLPGDKVSAMASNNGLNIRIVKGYDMTHKVETLSMDMLCGAFMIDTRRATLLAEY